MNNIKIFSLVVFAFLLKENSSSFLNDNEFLITVDLIKEFEIRHCVLVSDDMFISDVKKFSSIKLSVTYVACNKLPKYIADEHDYYFKIGIIFKDCDMSEVEVKI